MVATLTIKQFATIDGRGVAAGVACAASSLEAPPGAAAWIG